MRFGTPKDVSQKMPENPGKFKVAFSIVLTARKRQQKILSDLVFFLECSFCYGAGLGRFWSWAPSFGVVFVFGLECFDSLYGFCEVLERATRRFVFFFPPFFSFLGGGPGLFSRLPFLVAARPRAVRTQVRLGNLCLNLLCFFLLSLPGSAPPPRLFFSLFCFLSLVLFLRIAPLANTRLCWDSCTSSQLTLRLGRWLRVSTLAWPRPRKVGEQGLRRVMFGEILINARRSGRMSWA